MPIKLTLKNDLPVPSKALKDFASTTLNTSNLNELISGSVSERFKRLFSKENKKKQEDLIARLDDLGDRILRAPDGKMLWFVRWYLTAFDNKVSEEAIAVFETISETDSFKTMEAAANEWRTDQQVRATQLSKTCAAILKPLSDETTGVVALAKQLSGLLTQTIPSPIGTPPVAESTIKKLKQHKAYYDLGLITENEYLAFLVETKNILSEVAEGAAPGAPVQPDLQQIEQTKTWISGLTNDIRIVCQPLMTALSGLQQTTADMSNATGPVGTLSEQQEKDIKTAIKKTLLAEASKMETINESLLLLGALLAALTAVFGWVKKAFNFPAGGNYWNGQGTIRAPQRSDQIETAIQGMTQAAGAAVGPDNKEYDSNGKAVGKTEASKAVILQALQTGQAQFAAIQNRSDGLQTPNLSLRLGIPNTNPSYARINLLAISLDQAIMSVPTIELAKVINTLAGGGI